ncbi:cell division protein ZipA C-terminal FtsZ-binding domain-containing protein [Acinetobacter shaoyimingii]|uniref:Cell division protein ZipA n=1 Tax=Acinetobacter shaoyimingii TaxID=2715164 RepID=A0A6G8RY26_9GAMM|nr:cell division protein ZipA C-terminal FtsZ-binding domain-containing protein [Acinetobacter shaoyimingii]QIO06764.1 cell division protein ZipA [Acinetobacter shaoyimingii]
MEVTTIIGIVVAIIICLFGLRMMLRKPNDAAPSLDSELHINSESQQPVIPRHVRDQLQTENVESTAPVSQGRIEPSLSDLESEPSVTTTDVSKEELTKSHETAATAVVSEATESDVPVKPVAEQATEIKDESSEAQIQQADVHSDEVKKADPEFTLNPNVEAAKIEEFTEESNILDLHLHEQQRFDDESALANAEYIISLNMYPNPRKALSGDKTLKVLLKYGLRFGEMNCFHRYESPDQESPLMFSVLRITDQGPAGFDLETLSVEQVQGLAFFLALPHQNVQKGYDSMVSIAGLIARETDGTVYDENNLEFTPQLKEHWRHKAIDYRSNQAV